METIEDVFFEQMKRVRNCRPINFHCLETAFANEIAKSIVLIMKKLGVKPGFIFVYDERMARYRGLENFYGVSYEEYDTKHEMMCYTDIQIEDKYYCLVDYWPDTWIDGSNTVNCGYIQIIEAEHLGKIYGYLSTEAKYPSSKRRFTIENKLVNF